MKFQKPTIYLLLLTLLLTGCLATEIRDNILLPLASRVFDKVYPHIQDGLADAVADGDLTQEAADMIDLEAQEFGAVLRSLDWTRVFDLDWPKLEQYAARGVQAMVDRGDVEAAAATFLFQRIVNFRDLLSELAGKSVGTGSRSMRFGKWYLGEAKQVSLTSSPLDRHNLPRRRLGVPLVSAKDVGL